MKIAGLIGLVSLGFVAAPPGVATPVYSVIELGSLGGNATAYGINDNGDIVGMSQITPDGSSPLHAFLYRHASGSLVDLGTPGGSSSEAFSINDSGTIAGEVYTSQLNHGSYWVPVTWLVSGGSGSLQGPYPNGVGWYVSPNAISTTGVIVGQGYINDVAGARAVIYRNGTIANLGTLGGSVSFATAVSAQGTYIAGMSEVTGASDATNGLPTHAFLYRNGTRTDLGTLGGSYSAAAGVNEQGYVVGYSWTGQSGSCTPSPYSPTVQHAFLSVNGKMTDLGNLASQPLCNSTAEAINNSGEIVGRSDAITSTNVQVERAFYEANGQMTSLTFMDWGDPAWGNVRFTDAVAINCNGWIAANGSDSSSPNVQRVYLLIPKGALRSQCPAPK